MKTRSELLAIVVLMCRGGAKNRIDTLAWVATALDRHLILSFPVEVPEKLSDAVQVA